MNGKMKANAGVNVGAGGSKVIGLSNEGILSGSVDVGVGSKGTASVKIGS